MSQEDTALSADITTAYLGQVERGQKNVTVFTLEKICSALDVTLNEFFNNTENDSKKEIDEISNQILFQLRNKSTAQKKAVLNLIKVAFSAEKGQNK